MANLEGRILPFSVAAVKVKDGPSFTFCKGWSSLSYAQGATKGNTDAHFP